MRNKDSSGGVGRGEPFSRESYSRLLDKVFTDVISESDRLDRERSVAPDVLLQLVDLTPQQRQLFIHNSPQFRAWPLIEEALGKCRELWGENPERAEEFARLALDVANASEPSGFRRRLLSDALAEIWTHIANCKRIASDLQSSQEAFARAEKHLAAGTGDPMERARLLDLKSSLLRATRNFKAASDCLSEAISLYSRFPDRHAEGRARLKQAVLVRHGGEPQRAISLLEHAATLIDVEREPRLKLLVAWNLAEFLFETNELKTAQRMLAQSRELARVLGTRHDRLRLLWLEGQLRARMGQLALAEEALRQAREGFIAAGIGYNVALVSLDLAALCLETSRTEEVRQLAIETMLIFTSRKVQRELVVSWRLFQEAAEKDRATTQLIREVAASIREGGAAGLSEA